LGQRSGVRVSVYLARGPTSFRPAKPDSRAWLKLLGFLVAVAAGFCEEVIFRKWLMDLMRNHGFHLAVQITASALLFGLAHGVWGLFRGSIRAAAGAVTATSILGFMLAIVYLLSHRIVAPCVLAHFLINLFIEPGLVLAAVRGEMGRPLREAATGDAE
jgi:membrane protease YdiL (CAAX protease family)